MRAKLLFLLACALHAQVTITISQQAATKNFNIYTVTATSPTARKLDGAAVQQAVEAQHITVLTAPAATLLLAQAANQSVLSKVMRYVTIGTSVASATVAFTKGLSLATISNDTALGVVMFQQLETDFQLSGSPSTTIQTILGQALKPTEVITLDATTGWQGLILGIPPSTSPAPRVSLKHVAVPLPAPIIITIP